MTDGLRLLGAAATLLGYSGLCLLIYRRHRRRARQNAARADLFAGVIDGMADGTAGAGAGADQVLVLFGSQTGQAEALAWQTAQWLHQRGRSARVLPLNEAGADTLLAARAALFIASTYGEGDAPDGASLFAEKLMGAPLELSSLRYAVLALGDRQYANFCAFGRRLDRWLHESGALRRFERIDVDNAEPAALAAWRAQIGGNGNDQEGTAAPATDAESPLLPWRLAERRLLNRGSQGGPVFLLGFTPPAEVAPEWESGDLVRLQLGGDPGRPRDYSIASIPEDGSLQLLVRQEIHPDGSLGAASGLLTSALDIGDSVHLRLRAHRQFRLGRNRRLPLILIGNGTGLAGLRSHLHARAAIGAHDNWLIFGERQARHDFLCREEIEGWQREGVLRRLDMVFSRDQEERRHVQHRLLQCHEELLDWIAGGAAIYVCGSLRGMASGVDAALRQIAGAARVDELLAAGRLRRDVY